MPQADSPLPNLSQIYLWQTLIASQFYLVCNSKATASWMSLLYMKAEGDNIAILNYVFLSYQVEFTVCLDFFD